MNSLVPTAIHNASTLVALLQMRAATAPAQQAFIFLEDGDHETARYTYAELDARARAIAALLLQEQAHGERVLICLPAGLEYIAAFFGCLYAGSVAVPVFPPDMTRPERTVPRLMRIVADAQARFALTDTPDLAAAPLLDAPALRWLDVRAADGITFADPAPPAETALLMYTSGSTGDPKGVMVSHANLLHNLRTFPGFVDRPCEGVVSWLPMYHDLGLVLGVLHPVFHGVPGVLMPPHAFVQLPMRWLRAIDRYRASASGGPNFAYDLCVRKSTPAERATLDLRRWTVALNGAEPVRAATLQRFTAAFAPAGFRHDTHYPSYGMAEATATITGGASPAAPALFDYDRQTHTCSRANASTPDARQLVGCGHSLRDQHLIIVDPATRLPCPDGQVGEIWISGPGVAQGYWNRPEETERIFRATLANGDTRHFLRTGDLGLLADEIVLTGRLKDVLIIRGVNHYPEDIEQTLEQSHPLLRPGCGAVFTTDGTDSEELVIVFESLPHRPADAAAIATSLRQALAATHALDAAAICLIPPGSIPKTSSGKIQRYACRERFLAGDWVTHTVWQTRSHSVATVPAASVAEWLRAYVARIAGTTPQQIDASQPFTRYGLNSMQTVEMTAELGRFVGTELPATLVWNYPTIQELARFVGGEGSAAMPESSQAATDEPIAIVGIGCRFPGARNLDAYWHLLCQGTDAIQDVPLERWDTARWYHPDPSVAGKITARYGGFLPDLEQFDAPFFSITPREAAHLDPRQRLVLETSWEALEDAGIPYEQVAGSKTGVFIATIRDDYDRMLYEDSSRIDAYTGTGNANSTVANRVSYVFGFHGPSLAVDTACSGSLVAIHLACQSLRDGESTLALAGGVNVILQPDPALFLSRAGALAPDGRCKAFDHRANGYVRSEGAGVLVLKRLSQARADGDTIYAVIQGSAVNQDGHTNGMMAPSGAAQEAVLREAYTRAGIAPAEVQYIEAHGTGTPLGDQIESRALGSVVGADRPLDRLCHIGSAKSNIGHTESAAGVAGLIKTALALKHRHLPASIHIEQPNPNIPFADLGLAVQRTAGDWPRPHERLVAGVSSFGFGGTNAHAVLVEAPAADAPVASSHSGPYVLPISARSAGAVRELASAYQRALQSGTDVAALCASVAHHRTHHTVRSAVAGTSHADLCAQLAFVAQGTIPTITASERNPVVFVFAGQGPRIGQAGQQLLATEPVFREALEACDRALLPHTGWSLLEALRTPPDVSRLDDIAIAHPVICAFQIALAALWRSWGIEPDMVIGQSMGEIAAAYVAGAYSLDDTMRIIATRSALMRRVVGQGCMAVAHLSSEQAHLLISGMDDRVSVAGLSSPTTTVLAGERALIERLVASLERRGIFARVPKGITVASHSPQMEPLIPELVAALADIRSAPLRIPMLSSLTARPIGAGELDAAYWGRHLREPFRMADVFATLFEQGFTTFVELSPLTTLVNTMTENGEYHQQDITAIPSLSRDENEQIALRQGLATLYSQGQPVDWQVLCPPAARIPLPRYPWQRERYWLDQLETRGTSPRHQTDGHPLLGEHRAVAAGTQQTWQTVLQRNSLHYLPDHTLGGAALLPATAFCEMALAAAAQTHPACSSIATLHVEQALWLDQGERTIQTVVTAEDADTLTVQIFSRPTGLSLTAWVRHARALLRTRNEVLHAVPFEVAAIQQRCTATRTGSEHYALMQERSIGYGPCFRGVEQIWWGTGEALGRLAAPLPVSAELPRYQLHPALLDAALQVTDAALGNTATVLPAALIGVEQYAPLQQQMWCHVALDTDSGAEDIRAQVRLFGEDGALLVSIQHLVLRPLPADTTTVAEPVHQSFYEVAWRPQALETGTFGSRHWLILGDSGDIGARLAQVIADQGGTAMLLPYRPTHALAETYDWLVQEGVDTGCTDIVHLWSLNAARPDNVDAIDATQDLGSRSAMRLVQTLLRRDGIPPRLWFVTAAAQPVIAGDAPNVAQAPIWGVGRVIANESPSIWGGLIDLDAHTDPFTAADQIGHALRNTAQVDQVAFRAGQAYSPHLVRGRAAAEGTQPVFRAGAAYLITGGLGGLGREVATWMIERGARRLILLGRTPLPPRSEWETLPATHPQARHVAAVRSLEAQGASIHIASADVGDEIQVQRFLADYRREGWPPIRGVIHAAGVTSDQLLMHQNSQSFNAALLPKLRGAWVLHQAFAATPLDFFMLFSSVTSLLGTVGQANYAAGNAFLDALAAYRHAHGLPATSINWGAWADVGAAARSAVLDDHSQHNGTRPISVAQGLEALGHLVRTRPVQVMVTPIDWPRFAAAFGGLPLFRALAHEMTGVSATQAGAETSALHELSRLDDPDQRIAYLTTYLARLVAGVLRLDARQIDQQQPVTALGIDSIMAVELKRSVSQHLGMNVSIVEWLKGASIAQIARTLAEQAAPAATLDLALPLDMTQADLAHHTDEKR